MLQNFLGLVLGARKTIDEPQLLRFSCKYDGRGLSTGTRVKRRSESGQPQRAGRFLISNPAVTRPRGNQGAGEQKPGVMASNRNDGCGGLQVRRS